MWEMTTPVDQDVAITLDYQTKRQIPASYDCRAEFNFNRKSFAIYVNQWKPGSVYIGVSERIQYGGDLVKLKAGTKYRFKVRNFKGGDDFESHYVVSTYGAKAAVNLKPIDNQAYLKL